MKKQISSISITQSCKVLFATSLLLSSPLFLLGLLTIIFGCVVSIFPIASVEPLTPIGIGIGLLFTPVILSGLNFLTYAIYFTLYNLVSKWVGGMEMETTQDASIKQIKRFSVFQTAKNATAVIALPLLCLLVLMIPVGIILGLVFGLEALKNNDKALIWGAGGAITFLVAIPLVFGVIFLINAIYPLLYNLLARWVGGLSGYVVALKETPNRYQLERISILKSSPFIVVFHAVTALIYVPAGVIQLFLGNGGVGMIKGIINIFYPFLYPLFGLVVFALGSLAYNFVAKKMGGIEVTVKNVEEKKKELPSTALPSSKPTTPTEAPSS